METMETIEETIISPMQQRAIDYCDKKQMPKIGRQIAVIAYMHGAQEERERCIKVMQEYVCKRYCTEGRDEWCNDCRRKFYVRKAIEKGGEG